MSTMAGNGLLMKALMGLRQKLSDNEIDSKEYKESLKLAQFGNHTVSFQIFRSLSVSFTKVADRFMISGKKIVK